MPVPFRKAPLAAAVALASPNAAVAANLQPDGSPFDIASAQPPNEESPAVAMDGDGNHVFVWKEVSGELFAQTFDASGGAISSQIPVNTVTAGTQGQPDVAMDSDGNFVVAWESDYANGFTYPEDIVYRRFDVNGNPVSGEIDVTNAVSTQYQDPSVDLATDGRVVIGFEDNTNDSVLAEVYDSTDTVVVSQFTVPQGGGTFYNDAAAAFTQSGEFAVAFTQFVSGNSNDVQFQLFDATGASVIGSDSTVASSTDNELNVVIDQDASGNFVLAWRNDDQEAILAQRVDLNGTLQGGTITAGPVGTVQGFETDVAMDDDGDFVVGWTSGYYESNSGTYVRAFAPDGTADTPAQPVIQASNEFNTVGVAVDADSSIGIVTWNQAPDADTTGGAIRGNRLAPPGNEAPNADAGSDQTVVTSAQVTLDGSGSDDAEGDIESFNWTQTGGPSVTLSDPSSPTPSFTAPAAAATLTFQLEVSDEDGASDTDSVSITVTESVDPIEGANLQHDLEDKFCDGEACKVDPD